MKFFSKFFKSTNMSTQNQFNDISVEDYTERSVVVRGETRTYKEDLKKLGGKYNGRLKGSPGWIFPKTMEKDIKKFIKDGKRIVSESEIKDSEIRTREWESKRSNEAVKKVGSSGNYTSSNASYQATDVILKRLDGIEKTLSLILKKLNQEDSDSEEEEIITKRLLR